MRNKDTRTQTINLGKIKTRDELFEALQTRLAMDFRASVQKNGLWDMLFVPVLTLVVLGLITGLLFYGSLQALADPHMLSAWLSPSTEAWLQSEAAANLPYGGAVGGRWADAAGAGLAVGQPAPAAPHAGAGEDRRGTSVILVFLLLFLLLL